MTTRKYVSPLVKASVKVEVVDIEDDRQVLQASVTIGGNEFVTREDRKVAVDLNKHKEKNAALVADASFSSLEYPETTGVNDGIIGGYPGNRRQEWSTKGEKEGAWVRLDWQQPQTIERIIFFVRINMVNRVRVPNRILAGEIEFSDGTKVEVGELDNTFLKGTSVKFPAKTVTWLKFTVKKVSDNTQNVGLAEMVVLRK